MEYVILALISLLIFFIVKAIKYNIDSNKPPRKLIELANLNTDKMQLVKTTETETGIVEEYTDGIHTIKKFILKPSTDAVKKENI